MTKLAKLKSLTNKVDSIEKELEKIIKENDPKKFFEKYQEYITIKKEWECVAKCNYRSAIIDQYLKMVKLMI